MNFYEIQAEIKKELYRLTFHDIRRKSDFDSPEWKSWRDEIWDLVEMEFARPLREAQEREKALSSSG